MRFTINAPDLTKPTYQSLEEYATKRFSKIEKLLPNPDQTDHEVRISIERSGDLFEVSSEIFHPERIFASSKHRDFRTGIDLVVDKIQRELAERKDKKNSLNQESGLKDEVNSSEDIY